MKVFIKQLKKLFPKIYDCSLNVIDYLLVGSTFFVFLFLNINVFLRFVFRKPMGLLDELATYGLIYITFLGAVRLVERYELFHADLLDFISP